MELYSNVSILRKAYPWGRAYEIKKPDGELFIFPSVTTILKLVKIQKYEDLKKKLGPDKMKEILLNASERGNILHKMLELFLLEWAKEKSVEKSLARAQIYAVEEAKKNNGENAKAVNIGRALFWNFYYDKFWENIDEVVANEGFLYTTFRGGWAGACDFVFRNKQKELIVDDFKSSSSIKDENDVITYKLQIVAYMFMCAEKYGEVPKMGRIRISNEISDEIQTFIVHDYEMKPFLKKFIELRKDFKNIHNI